jgi:hypothetical protein
VIRRVAILGLALAACRPATEIIVTIDTTFGVPCTIDALHIEATAGGKPVMLDVPVGDAPGQARLPGSITLLPRGDPREVTVTVSGMRDGAAFATASGVASFATENSVELRFVLDRSCVPGPCPAVGVGSYAGLPDGQAKRGCGAHGYAWKPALLAMRDACAMREAGADRMGIVLPDVDEAEDHSPLSPAMPFPFRFYGAPVTQIWAGTNGYIGFGDTAPGGLTGDVGPSRSLGLPGFPGKGVLAFWDDLRTSPAGVCFTVSGEFPDRVLWITWKDACFAAAGAACVAPDLGTLTFGIALEETTDRIYLGYLRMAAAGNADRASGSFATIGVTDAVPRGCPRTQCSTAGTCQDGTPCGYTEFSAGAIVSPLPTLEFDPQ